MQYTIAWSRRASRALGRLQPSTKRRVLDKVRLLASDPRPADCETLQGYPYYRIRVGDYRVIYDIRDDEILVSVVLVGHRREIYEQVRRL